MSRREEPVALPARRTSMRRTKLLRVAAATVVPLLLATACGDETAEPDSPATAETPTADGFQAEGPERVMRLSDGRLMSLYTGADTPRGGYQPHLFVVGDDGESLEVLADGFPVLSQVVTVRDSNPMTADCTDDGGIAVWTATTSEPPGIVLAWDVTRTTYEIGTDGTAEETGSKQVEDHAADPLLRKEMPELFDPTQLFADCEVS